MKLAEEFERRFGWMSDKEILLVEEALERAAQECEKYQGTVTRGSLRKCADRIRALKSGD